MSNSAPSNALAALAAEALRLKKIRQVVADSDRRFKGHQERLYTALADAYALTLDLEDAKLLVPFVQAEGGKWGKVADANPFQPIVALSFRSSVGAPSASKYAAVLQYARINDIEPAGIKDWLGEGIEKLLERARSPNTFDGYDETPKERMERALQALSTPIGKAQSVAAASIPEITGPAPEAAIADFRKALVRVVDGKIELVKVLASTASELEHEILAVAAKDPHLSRRKLAAKPLYDVFRACDLLLRFSQSSDHAEDQASDFAIPTSGDLDVEAWRRSIQQRSRGPKLPPNTNLRFRFDGDTWWADTISTRPTFPVIRVKLESDLAGLDAAKVYMISSQQAKRVVLGFVGSAEWSIRARKMLPSGHDVAGDNEIVVDELDTKRVWHELAQLTPSESLVLKPDTFAKVRTWVKAFKAKTGKMLSGQLSLGIAEGQLTISAAGEKSASSMLSLAPLAMNNRRVEVLKHRWLLRDDFLKLAEVQQDYGLPMESLFVDGSEQLAGLQLVQGAAAIILPLAVSLAADYAEIAQSMVLGAK